ncbi:MAG TPA: stalk domain-containing protein [Pseudobacteroides sp.]|nr:stalk domain-containing protein [Pseudobacteroides sp.]
MRKMTKRLLALCLALAMVVGTSATSFAAKTIEINGYERNNHTSKNQISITNVIRKDTKVYLAFADTYVCQAPVTVTALDNLALFGGSTLVPMGEIYIEGMYLDVEGKALYYDGKEKTYNRNEDSIGEFEFKKGAKFTITEPGIYYVYGRYPVVDGGVEVVLVVQNGDNTVSQPKQKDTSINATPTRSKVLVNGAAVNFEAYTINGNNYFKLRDVAKVVSGSQKQFDVTWDGSKNAINLISGQAYTVVGGELATGDGIVKKAVSSNSTIYKDNAKINLTAYTINGNNYFKLRDLGQAFNFGVTWDQENNAVVIDTTQGYKE